MHRMWTSWMRSAYPDQGTRTSTSATPASAPPSLPVKASTPMPSALAWVAAASTLAELPLVLMAKSTEPALIPTTSSEKVLKERLAELEGEIERLRKEAQDSQVNSNQLDNSYESAMKRLEAITKEKGQLQAALAANTQKLQQQERQILKQRQMILEQKERLDALLRTLDGDLKKR